MMIISHVKDKISSEKSLESAKSTTTRREFNSFLERFSPVKIFNKLKKIKVNPHLYWMSRVLYVLEEY